MSYGEKDRDSHKILSIPQWVRRVRRGRKVWVKNRVSEERLTLELVMTAVFEQEKLVNHRSYKES